MVMTLHGLKCIGSHLFWNSNQIICRLIFYTTSNVDLLNNIISLENDKYQSLLKPFIDQIKIWHHLMTFQQPTTIRPNNNLYICPLFPTSPPLCHPSSSSPPNISSYLLSSPPYPPISFAFSSLSSTSNQQLPTINIIRLSFPTSLLSPNLHPSPLPSPHISSYLISSPLLHLAQISAATLKCLADDVAGIGSGIMSFMLSLKYHTLSPGKPMEG